MEQNLTFVISPRPNWCFHLGKHLYDFDFFH